MRYSEIIAESIPYPLGHNMAHIVDLRDPKKKIDWDKKPIKQMLVLTKDGGAVLFNYGYNNIVPWYNGDESSVCNITSEKMDKTLQNDSTDISVFRNGFLIDSKRDDRSWGGIRSKYSNDLKPTLQALVDRGLATTSTPIWIGNWARRDGESLGSIGKILAKPAIPNRLILYHGTSNYRATKILRDGLNPIGKDNRIWKKGSTKDIEHRDDSIYLTSDLSRAQYYANKATNVDKVRLSRVKYREPWLSNQSLPNPDKMTDQQKIAWLKANLSEEEMQSWYRWLNNNHREFYKDRYGSDYQDIDYNIDRMDTITLTYKIKQMLSYKSPYDPDAPKKVEPIILKVMLGQADMKKLMADDDHIRVYGADPKDWLDSISRFGQVAYRGSIPPSRIKIYRATFQRQA